jgi:hypothetical protein
MGRRGCRGGRDTPNYVPEYKSLVSSSYWNVFGNEDNLPRTEIKRSDKAFSEIADDLLTKGYNVTPNALGLYYSKHHAEFT